MNKAGEKVDVAGYEYELWSRHPKPGHWWAVRDAGSTTVVRVLRISKGRWVVVGVYASAALPAKPVDAPFDPFTHARATDPVTSKAAARRSSVRAGSHKARLLQAYSRAAVGFTDEEAAIHADLLSVGYWKRCSDLRNDGLIEPVPHSNGGFVTRLTDNGDAVMVCSITDMGMATLASMKESNVRASHLVSVPTSADPAVHTCHPSGLEFDPKCEACCRERHPTSASDTAVHSVCATCGYFNGTHNFACSEWKR